MADLVPWGARVRTLREKRGWTVAELARRAGITQTYIAQLESDTRPKVGLNVVVALASALRASLDDLVGFDANALPAEAPAQKGSDARMDRLEANLLRLTEALGRMTAPRATNGKASALRAAPAKKAKKRR